MVWLIGGVFVWWFGVDVWWCGGVVRLLVWWFGGLVVWCGVFGGVGGVAVWWGGWFGGYWEVLTSVGKPMDD